MLHKDEAIVLFKRAYGESDKIIRLFTLTSGKIAAIAKGASKSQKRFANTLEPFNHIRVEYFEKFGKGLVRIDNADIVETNSGIERSLRRASTAAFFTEFADRLTKDRERNIDLFHTLKEVLLFTKQRELSYMDILRYELKMLETLGYMPNFTACVYCGKNVKEEMKVCFSRERGGILCSACSSPLPHRVYSAGTIPGIARIGNNHHRSAFEVHDKEGLPYMQDTGDVKRFEREAREIMEGFISFHLDVEFKSYRILKSLMG
ncbi:MAG: DNA repair protein RecO [Syntrophus sp. (in: bacteria)]|nr:DNA repair protein RecO [Syntrophus sp. (in: bacteria)]